MSDRLRIVPAVIAAALAAAAAGQLWQRRSVPTLSDPRPTDIVMSAAWRNARQSVLVEEWPAAVRQLQDLLLLPNDGFTDDSAESIKGLVVEELNRLPEAGREAYVGRYAGEAGRLLQDAAGAGRLDGLLRAAAFYRWTPAGAEAGWRAVRALADAGRYAEAGRLRSDLIKSGASPPADLPDSFPRRADVRRPARRWLGGGGDASAAAVAGAASVAGDGAWTRVVLDEASGDPRAAEAAETISLAALGRPAGEPLLVGGRAVVAGPDRVRAYDTRTGELRWRSAVMDAGWRAALANAAEGGVTADDLRQRLVQSVVMDGATAQPSSDGRLVFAVYDNLGDAAGLAESSNRLAAYEADTGRLVWSVGGPRSGVAPAELAGVSFLAAPTPLEGRLWVLALDGGQVRLFAVDPPTGRVLMTQDLWLTYDGFSERVRGYRPVAADGRLVLPVGGAVVCFDPLSRAVAWTTELPRDAGRNAVLRRLERAQGMRPAAASAWSGPPVRVHAGRAVVSDADLLVALSTEAGSPEWAMPREGGRWVESVTPEGVLVVEDEGLRMHDLADGSVRWKRELPGVAGGGVVSGDGVSGGRVVLPLESGELAAVRLEDGELLARLPTRSGRPLGNLVAAGGAAVAFDGLRVVGFSDEGGGVFAARRALLNGEPEAAVDTLAAAADSEAKRATLAAAFERLLARDGGRVDPAAYEAAAALPLDGVRDETGARLTRLLSEHARRLGDDGAALRFEVRQLSFADVRETVEVAPGRRVLPSELVIAGLHRLAGGETSVSDAEREAVVAELERQLADPVVLARYGRRVPASLMSEERRLAAWEASRTELEREVVGLELLRDGGLSDEGRGRVAKWIAEAYYRAALDLDLLALLDTLDPQPEWAAELRGRSRVVSAARRYRDWPAGEVDVRKRSATRAMPKEDWIPLRRGPDGSRQHVRWTSLKGGAEIKVAGSLLRTQDEFETQQPQGYRGGQVSRVQTIGHLAAVCLPRAVLLRDYLTDRPYGLASLPLDGGPAFGVARAGQAAQEIGPGLLGTLYETTAGVPLGTAGPLSPRRLVLTSGRTLTAVDPFDTRTVLWSVDGVPAGGEVFGDERTVLVRDPESAEVLRFDARDGAPAGRTRLPEDVWNDGAGAALGTAVLTNAEGRSVGLFDLAAERPRWAIDCGEGAMLSRPEEGRLIVCEPGGRVRVVSAAGGAVLSETTLKAERPLTGMDAVSDGRRLFVFTKETPGPDSPPPGRWPTPFSPDRAIRESVVADGPAAAFDRDSGGRLWTRRLDRQAVPTHQSDHWPVLVAAIQRVDNSGKVPQAKNRVELIDKATGETRWADGDLEPDFSLHYVPRIGSTPGMSLYFGGYQLAVTFREAEPPPAAE